MVENESRTRMIGYGGMPTESVVAIMALVTAVILDRHRPRTPGRNRSAPHPPRRDLRGHRPHGTTIIRGILGVIADGPIPMGGGLLAS